MEESSSSRIGKLRQEIAHLNERISENIPEETQSTSFFAFPIRVSPPLPVKKQLDYKKEFSSTVKEDNLLEEEIRVKLRELAGLKQREILSSRDNRDLLLHKLTELKETLKNLNEKHHSQQLSLHSRQQTLGSTHKARIKIYEQSLKSLETDSATL